MTTARKALALMFVAILWLPLVQMARPFARLQVEDLVEFRDKAPLPHLNLATIERFPAQFERYFRDNFGFRDLLVQLNNSISYRLLGVSSIDTILRGEDDWLFYIGEGALENFQGLTLLTPQQLERFRRIYEARAKFVQSLGATYLLMIVPNKESVYPERFPPQYRKAAVQRYDQFLAYMREHSFVRIVDPKPALLAAKVEQDVYRKSDGHWNSIGAHVGYQALFDTLHGVFPQLRLTPRSMYRQETAYEIGELGRMSGLYRSPTFPYARLVPLEPDRWFDAAMKLRGRGAPMRIDRTREIGGRTDVRKGEQLAKAVVYRDSFFVAMIPFFTRHFEQSVILTTHKYKFDAALIEQERPTVVVDQLIERYLKMPSGAELQDIDERLSGKKWSEMGERIAAVDSPVPLTERNRVVPISTQGRERAWAVITVETDVAQRMHATPGKGDRDFDFAEAVPYDLEPGRHELLMWFHRAKPIRRIRLAFEKPESVRRLSIEMRGRRATRFP